MKQALSGSDSLSCVSMEREFIPGRGNCTEERGRPGGGDLPALVTGQALDPLRSPLWGSGVVGE